MGSRSTTSAALASGAIVRHSSSFTCRGHINVPPLESTTDIMNTVVCELDASPTTTCKFKLYVGPHPLLQCPPGFPLTPSGAAAAATVPFVDNPAVTCNAANVAADIPAQFFPAEVGQFLNYIVTCRSTETPNKCDIWIVLRAGAPPCHHAAML